MGIDAEMLVRYRGPKPSERQIAEWSWNLCNSIGASKFFISDGLPGPEYKKASAAWHRAFNAHPLALDGKWENDKTIHQQILDSLGKPPEQLRRAIDLSFNAYADDPAPPGAVWEQDGDDIVAGAGETFLKVSLWTRFYGEGYERGDILTICAVAEWIEQNMQPCEVWYGGDSSGVCAEPFPKERREELRALLYSQNGRDYFRFGAEGTSRIHPAPCGLCIPGEPRFSQCGWGQDYMAVHCQGCGKTFEKRGNDPWKVSKE